ncbi:conjugal transfer protein TraB [Affinibrenneria salicis]|uniref:Conjugal transfer protein TraB n=1 Tax=Affinibrenneria salicis TaxID=2590031 RepID=A0A5J5G2B7_9GAMM|nr:TraB/GumN family protein [Affinibrenneria salicis]KAA9000027.1 conjugal transfer protein TraB [Affinibrenneria salicis]
MGQLLRRIAAFLGLISPLAYGYPAIDIQLPDNRQLHLVGSIHMGTIEMSPLPETLQQLLQQADALIVEADIAGDGASPFQPEEARAPLAQRLSPALYEKLRKICGTLAFSEQALSALPAWQAALMLQARQAQQLGLRPDYGIDYQMINAAKAQGIKIIELEGAASQIDLLQQLPQDGLPLLEDTLFHWHANARLLQTMVGWWLEARPGAPAAPLPATFSHEMNDLLMNQRNRRWQQVLQALPAGRYVVAVGALHLYGDNNLPDLLQHR